MSKLSILTFAHYLKLKNTHSWWINQNCLEVSDSSPNSIYSTRYYSLSLLHVIGLIINIGIISILDITPQQTKIQIIKKKT